MIVAAAILLAATVNAGEQKVYKCGGADGAVTFSPVPCGSNSQEMHVEVSRKPPPPQQSDDGNPTATPAQPPQQSDALRDISDSVADSDCRRAANRMYVEPDTSEIDQLNAQVRALESTYYVNTRTGAQTTQTQMVQQEDRVRAATIRSTIAIKEQQVAATRADSRRVVREALVRCDDQKIDREKARTASK